LNLKIRLLLNHLRAPSNTFRSPPSYHRLREEVTHMGVTKKIVDDAVSGLRGPKPQRRNSLGQFHGPLTPVPDPAAPIELPEVDFTGWPTSDVDVPIASDLPGEAAVDDGCEDGLGDF
jgi:hypothetical protein